jgi:hypothetical protein
VSIDVYPPPQLATAKSVLGRQEVTTGGPFAYTTNTELPGLTLPVYIPANRTIRVTVRLWATFSLTNAVGEVQLDQDGAQLTRSGKFNTNVGHAQDWEFSHTFTPTAGVHTYSVRARPDTVGGTLTWYPSATIPSYIIVEDVTGGTGGPGPILLDYKQLVATQSGITTLADVTNLSCTVNVPAGRALKITGKMQVLNNTTIGDAYLPILEGAVTIGRVTYITAMAVDSYHNPIGSIIVFPSPGVHTYKVQASKYTGGGSLTIAPNSDNPAYLMVEDVTGTEAPTGAYYEALWTPVTSFLNSWVNYDPAIYEPAAYRKVNDLVYLRGLIKNGSPLDSTAFMLPAGYRPLKNAHLPIVSNNLFGLAEIKSPGDVRVNVPSSAWVSLAGIVFGVT